MSEREKQRDLTAERESATLSATWEWRTHSDGSAFGAHPKTHDDYEAGLTFDPATDPLRGEWAKLEGPFTFDIAARTLGTEHARGYHSPPAVPDRECAACVIERGYASIPGENCKEEH